jgi:pyruvate dehydrogenase E2 component (dihydrolipoyllysine-residue acetyltransferase)
MRNLLPRAHEKLETSMLEKVIGLTIAISAFAYVPALAQTPAPAAPDPTAQAPAAPAPAAPAPATGQAQPPARGGAGTKAGPTGNPDPGVNFLVVVENPHVRVLQVTLQPGAVRRPHVHNDVTFHVLVPVTGSLELTVEKDPVVTAVPGQAYYMVKGQTHGFTNKSSAAVQVIELFIKPDPGTMPAAAGATPPAAAPAVPAAPPAAK